MVFVRPCQRSLFSVSNVKPERTYELFKRTSIQSPLWLTAVIIFLCKLLNVLPGIS